MSQKYVTDGAWLICSEGKMMQKLKVDSQHSIHMHGQLAATALDRTGENFNCLKMAMAGAIAGAVIAAAAIAATVLTGGIFVGVMAMTATVGTATVAGAAIGSMLAFVPCICNLLTKPNRWTVLQETVLFEGKQALLENATLACLLGGMVSIVKTNIKMAIDMAMLCDYTYAQGAPLPEGWTDVPEDQYPDGLKERKIWEDKDSNFFAQLFQGPDGSYAVIFRGTQPPKVADWKNNVQQAFGMESEQYERTYKLSKKIKHFLSHDTVIFAGHSLGGGKAALAGAETGFPTYTYNAAGLHERTLERNELNMDNTHHVQAFGSDDDPLSILQDNRDLVGAAIFRYAGVFGRLTARSIYVDHALPQAAGQRIGLDTDVGRFDPLKGHSIPPLIEVLKAEDKQSPNIQVITKDK